MTVACRGLVLKTSSPEPDMHSTPAAHWQYWQQEVASMSQTLTLQGDLPCPPSALHPATVHTCHLPPCAAAARCTFHQSYCPTCRL